VKYIESPDSVFARVGAVESCWFSYRQNVQADSALCLPEKVEPQGEVVERITWDPANRCRRRERGGFEVTDSSEEVSRRRNDEADMVETTHKCTHLVAARRLAGDHFRDVSRPFHVLVVW
jgi:hypothetical protein